MNMYLKLWRQLRYELCISPHSHLVEVVDDNVQIYQASDLIGRLESDRSDMGAIELTFS